MTTGNYGKRPVSANNMQKDLYESSIPKQYKSKNNSAAMPPLPVNTNKKASKCLKQVNWTKNWFHNAYMSIDASNRLNRMLDTSSDKAGDKGLNTEDSERPLTINSQPRFSSTNGHKG